MTPRPSPPVDEVFDPGLQPERTLLAWRRTTLSLAVASALLVRLGAPSLGPAVAVAGLAGVALCAVAYVGAAAQYRRVHDALVGSRTRLSPGGACAALTAALLLVGAGALALVAGPAVTGSWP